MKDLRTQKMFSKSGDNDVTSSLADLYLLVASDTNEGVSACNLVQRTV
jgi:hypothetical protein